MKVSFFLTRPKSENETSIYARLCFAGHKTKYYIPESINPRFWSKESQRAKETKKFKEYPEFNTRLDNIESKIKNVYRTYINDRDGEIPHPDTLRKLLDTAIKKVEAEKEVSNTFFGFFDSLIKLSEAGIRLNPKTGQPISPNTIKTYNTAIKHLREFQSGTKRKIDFDSIDLDFYSEYTKFLTKNYNLSTNAIGKDIQIIKLVMNEATERGINANIAYKGKRFVTVREKVDSIYLNEEEIAELERLDLSRDSKLERVRDLFLVGCRTGLRYSDYSILQINHITDGFIDINQTKTGDPVVIPLHPSVQKIIAKYDGKLPKSISNQKTNDYLKELGERLPSLNVTVSKTFTKGGVKLIKSFSKWELLVTHTARRSFATNEYKAGTPTLTIMAVTGHKTEKAFMRYIRLTSQEHAKIMKGHWEKRNNLIVV